MSNYTIHKTRFEGLGYVNFGKFWQFVDMDSPNEWGDQIGAQYATKDELLSDLTRYGREWSGTSA